MIGSREIIKKDRINLMIFISFLSAITIVYLLFKFVWPVNLLYILIVLINLELIGLIAFYDLFWFIQRIHFFLLEKKKSLSSYDELIIAVYKDRNRLIKKFNVLKIHKFQLSKFNYGQIIIIGKINGCKCKFIVTRIGVISIIKTCDKIKDITYRNSKNKSLANDLKILLSKRNIDFDFRDETFDVTEIIKKINSTIILKRGEINDFLKKNK